MSKYVIHSYKQIECHYAEKQNLSLWMTDGHRKGKTYKEPPSFE